MKETTLSVKADELRKKLKGDLYLDNAHRIIYATDASAYREIPFGVARPKDSHDLKELIAFARETDIPLIPRAAGTSLAGQVVGKGLVVDVSKYMTRILEINREEHWVRVEPGVNLDELNRFAAPYGLFFGPETSTSSRCMIGGMVGNNSCGAHSILYGSTRDHVISVKCILSDGSEAAFGELTPGAFREKMQLSTLEGAIYRQIHDILSDAQHREEIRREFPDPALHRRNTGYAIDLLAATQPFGDPAPFNFCKLLAGSEGTLAFLTEIKLNLVPLPPKEKALVCVHCRSVDEALRANLIALEFGPGSVELMDKAVMDCTRDNITQRKNRFFVEGDPGAILIVEFAAGTREEILQKTSQMEAAMRAKGLGYHFPVVFPPELKRVWDLRKAGLGVLSNYPGDRKPVPVTEDTAVSPEALPEYIAEFTTILDKLGLACVYYAHCGSGELHLRPVLNLKDPADVELFHTIALESARLVKKYRGSLSGEHGDGRLRGEFIPLMIGEKNYALLQQVKDTWDPQHLLNPGKITGTPAMNTQLRYSAAPKRREIPTVFDFSATQGILRAAEKCNGSADCRNSVLTGKWMCPSYMATKDENATTRARANVLREFLTRSDKENPFDHTEIYEVMDLCLSCKACKAECPSNVDMARLKAEFLQHYYESRPVTVRTWLFANITTLNRLGSIAPAIYNFFQQNRFISGLVKRFLGVAVKRSLPRLSSASLRDRYVNLKQDESLPRTVYLFADEFTNFNDPETGINAIRLLNRLGFRVIIPDHDESGRAAISKGLIRQAQKRANFNVARLKDLITSDTPLIGIEPSAILTFRDEYPDLVDHEWKDAAQKLAESVFLYDEFLVRQMEAGVITKDQFTRDDRHILLHGHCHQKALASVEMTKKMLSFPEHYTVEEIPSGCCGMAGSFGYEAEHYDVSMKIGELVLFPAIRQAGDDVIIAAPGTSCRSQINDGTGRVARHPLDILYDALVR
ncbi:MAG TPA: FAD-linked oxidase C-terminal domain-containing protein [Bacteroidales bacterium]|nr:FAD-linked oxidase C-terminal domain-containing protein [Bacteroidales bacterium]HPS73798.1 FAD-linked oxidase C-terminal domain-containing protein [Bacteroidales bacterium]